MERIHARALETENRVRMLETDGMRLQLYQTMLTTVSTQAMLLLGFALAEALALIGFVVPFVFGA